MTGVPVAAREAAVRIDRLADELAARGHLTDSRIRRALHAAPRHLFAPRQGWCAPDGPGPRRAIDRDADPGAWWDAVYSDASIVTQAADGAADPAAGTAEATSSLSGPGAVVAFLALLRVHHGDRVLDVGTGTGWTAALLEALGASVVTVEVDPAVAARAAAVLAEHGFTARPLVADGARGAPGRGPFDAVHATCGVTTVPYAWVEQTRPGGRIVAPWMPEYGEGHKLQLTVTGDGRAIGRMPGTANYMMLRAQRTTLRMPGDPAAADESSTRLDPRAVTGDSYGADIAVAGMLPDLMAAERHDGDHWELLLADLAGTSWARVIRRPGGPEHRVLQWGPRRLWDDLEAAYLRWLAWGRPGRDQFGMTVTETGQHIWLNSPDNPVARRFLA